MSYSLLTSLITSISEFTAGSAGSAGSAGGGGGALAAAASAAATASATGCHHDDGCGGERSESGDEWTSWRRIYDGGYGDDGPCFILLPKIIFYANGEENIPFAQRPVDIFFFADTT